MPTVLTKDTALSLSVVILVTGAVWWAATQDTRTRNMEDKVAPIPQMQQDIAAIKARLEVSRTASK
jgi:hypothetical protein